MCSSWVGGREGFSIAAERRGGALWVTPAGELDMATVEPLKQQVVGSRPDDLATVVVDLRQLEFMDSSGPRILLEAQAEAQTAGWELLVVPGRPPVQRIFELTGTTQALRFLAPSEGVGHEPD